MTIFSVCRFLQDKFTVNYSCVKGAWLPLKFSKVKKVGMNRAHNGEKIKYKTNEEERLVCRKGKANSMALGGEHNKQHTADDSNSDWECCEELLGFI